METEIVETPIARAVSLAGSQSALALLIGVTQGAVWKWVHAKKKVSPVHAVAISQALNGRVLPHELRPDLPTVFPAPDLANESTRA
ncbi:helix-turn-helix domain-containing protein [Serratia fonticola]|uniref:transcriptional regulator n=1 Tax=Serratia fonticola TaxID=47917 RepID=UPI003AAA48A9